MIYAIDPTMYPRLIADAVQARDRDSLDWYRRQASEQINAAKDAANAQRWRAVMLAARLRCCEIEHAAALVDPEKRRGRKAAREAEQAARDALAAGWRETWERWALGDGRSLIREAE